MTFAIAIEVLLALLKFPAELSAFVKILQKTPEEQHNDLMASIQAQADTLAQTGRPG